MPRKNKLFAAVGHLLYRRVRLMAEESPGILTIPTHTLDDRRRIRSFNRDHSSRHFHVSSVNYPRKSWSYQFSSGETISNGGS
jgi:hypothetical protein